MQVSVEPEALAEWSAHACRTGLSLDARLAALDEGIAPLARTWHGAAADTFTARRQQWRGAADGLIATLSALSELVDTARANYEGADRANALIWRGGEPAVVVLHAMSAGHGRIRADLEDIRAAVGALVAAAGDLAGAWDALARGLVWSGAMAGGDDVGSAFAADHDGMVAAAWQGWRSSALLLDGIAGGLAATGNNLADAERTSTAGAAARPFVPITASTKAVPSPALPPAAGGDRAVGQLVAWWPTADPDRLRAAAVAWRGSAVALRAAVARAFDAVDTLLAANPGPALEEMRRFTRAALSDEPTSGLTGVLAGAGGRIASACEGLADLIEDTRARILATYAHHLGGGEWYHPVANLVDFFVRVRAARAIAAAADAYLLDLALSAIRDEHVRAVDLVRAELHPEAADRLARLATAMSPPTPVPANTCAVQPPDGPVGAPVPEAQRQALIAEVVAAGHKISPPDVVGIARAPDGRVVWLERGGEESGLSHILRAGRIAEFSGLGVRYDEIAGLPIRAVTSGTRLGRVRGADVYDVALDGGRHAKIVVVVGSNGYVVSAYPLSARDERKLEKGGS